MKKNLAGMLNISGNMISVNLMSDIKETTIMGKKSYCADIVMSADGMDVYYTLYYVPNNKDSFISIVKISNEYLKNTVYDEAADQIINSIKLK